MCLAQSLLGSVSLNVNYSAREDIYLFGKMEEIYSSSSKRFIGTASELLLVGSCFTLLAWYVQLLWSRRKLYLSAGKIPGPFAFPLIGCAIRFMGSPYTIFANITEMFDNYPGVFRVWFGPRLFYAVSDPKYFEILLPACLRKEPLYKQASVIVGLGLFTAPVNKWKKHRKLIAPTFHQKILDDFVEVFAEHGEILVEQLKHFSGKGEFDIFHVISKCTLDIICETAMGVRVNAQTTDAMYTKWTDRILEIIFLRIFTLWHHFDTFSNMTPLGKECREIVRNMHKFSGKVVREKKLAFEEKMKNQKESSDTYFEEEPIKRKAFLDYLLEVTSDENTSFTEMELREEVDTFIIAGSDTTASTNCFAFSMLGLHQDLQDKVYNEIIDIIGPNRAVESSDLPKLKYMERFLKETLRLFPVAGVIVRAIDEDIKAGDFVFQSGASVVFGILRAHTNEKYWPNPFKFDPDRFLPEEAAKRHPCAYVPFSYGPRNCIGPRYAMMAMKSVLCSVLRRYRIFTSYKKVEDVKLKANLVLRPKDGYKVSVEIRNI